MWKQHIWILAHKSFPHAEVYIVNHVDQGVGGNALYWAMYKVYNLTTSSGPNPLSTLVFPVALFLCLK